MPSPGLTSSELHFPSTHSSLDVLKESCSQSLLLPFLALFPSTPPPHSPCTVFSALTPHPQLQRPLCPMSWGMEFPGHFSSSLVISCQVPPTHFPSTQLWPGPWKRNRNSLVPSMALFSVSPFLSPPTTHFCPLSFEQGEDTGGESSLCRACLVVLGVS